MLPRSISALRSRVATALRRSNDAGSIRSSGGVFGKKEAAQENAWAHQRDLEHLKDLQEKLKKAHAELEAHTSKILEKSTKK